MIIETTVLLGIVIGLVEVVKKTEKIPDEFLPMVAVLIGIGISYLGNFTELLNGIMLGLAAVGLFSSVKNTVVGVKNLSTSIKIKIASFKK
jgi:hypothetical protein